MNSLLFTTCPCPLGAFIVPGFSATERPRRFGTGSRLPGLTVNHVALAKRNQTWLILKPHIGMKWMFHAGPAEQPGLDIGVPAHGGSSRRHGNDRATPRQQPCRSCTGTPSVSRCQQRDVHLHSTMPLRILRNNTDETRASALLQGDTRGRCGLRSLKKITGRLRVWFACGLRGISGRLSDDAS